MSVSSVESAPIPALIAYYRRLEQDPEQEIAPFGFSRQRISFRVVLELDGRLHAIEDVRNQQGKRKVAPQLVVPGQSKPPGVGINPCFLWDNAAYMLGYKPDDPKPERTIASFEAFRERHLQLEGQIDDEQFVGVCRFLKQWDPAKVEQAPGYDLLEELGTGFGIFQVRAQPGYVHERKAVLEYWEAQLPSASDPDAGAGARVAGQSLVSGRVGDLARLHEPKIKGVVGGQPAGGVLVGFNEDAYTSYGRDKSYNAPVAEDEAFEYCTALNRLLASEEHYLRLGDATVAFWSGRPDRFESLAAALFDDAAPSLGSEDTGMTRRVAGFFDALRRGTLEEVLDEPQTPFYVLGLAPNAARISVRFWLTGTVKQFAERMAIHLQALDMHSTREEAPVTIRRMLLETAREAKDVSPQLAGEVSRSILAGADYPHALYSGVLRRLRADRSMNFRRAAILKAFLIRNYNMEVPVALNKDHSAPAYHMGRLFAALEKTQQDALPGLNKTIKDGYFATASTTPASVFPRILKLHQHHIEKLEGGMRVNRERLIQEICSHIEQFPVHLPLEQQGLFHIAYYHQRQDFFTKRSDDAGADAQATSEETANV